MLEDIRNRDEMEGVRSSNDRNHADEASGESGFEGMNYEQIRQPFLPQHGGHHPGEGEGSRKQDSPGD